jgi:Stress responsive A/B Barrel Domain
VISHIVLFRAKDGLTPQQRSSFALKIQEACRVIPNVRRALVGRCRNIDAGYSRSLGDNTYEFAAVLDFDSVDDLRSYLQHPLHRDLGRQFWQCCESTIVMDVEAVDAMMEEISGLLVEEPS